MNLDQAYRIFGLDQSASDDDIKKRFREMSKTLHPDVNKSENADEKFKELNSAYQLLQTRNDVNPFTRRQNSAPPPQSYGSGFSGFPGFGFPNIGDIFNTHTANNIRQNVENIMIELEITFAESVYGVTKNIQYNRDIACSNCDGNGFINKHNNCNACGGRGFVESRNGNMVMRTMCNKCYNRKNTEKCNVCNAKSYVNSTTSLSVKIPPGIKDGMMMKMGGAGNYAGNLGGSQHIFSDAIARIKVKNNTGLNIVGDNVVFNAKIDFSNAILGTEVSVPTPLENEFLKIKVPPFSKNKDVINIPNLGVGYNGSLEICLDVQMPDKTNAVEIFSQLAEKLRDSNASNA